MEVTAEAPVLPLPAPLKPYVDIRTGRSYATRDELDRAKSRPDEFAGAVSGSSAAPDSVARPNDMDVDGDKGGDVATSVSADDEPSPRTPPDAAGPAALELAMSLRSLASGAVDEPFACSRCRVFKCSHEPNLEAHLRQCRRRKLPAHLEVAYPPSSLFPTPAQLREASKRPGTNEGLSSLVKASRIAPNTVAIQTVFAAPPVQHAAPVAPRRAARPPKEQSMSVPRGGNLIVTSPSGLVFLIRREARSKRFKCPRCNSFSAGNPVNYHEHVDHECTAPWPTEVPAASNPVKPAGRARGRQAAVAPASPAAAPAAPLLNLPPPSPPPKRSPGPSEGLSADDMSIDAEGEADLAEMGIRSAARMDPELVPQLAAGPIGSTPAHDSAFFPTLSPAGTLAAPTSSTNAQMQSSAGLSSEALTKRGAPRRSESARSLKVKPVTLTQDELSDDEDHPEYEAVASEELDSEEEERLSRPRVGEPKRKNRASTAASDGSKPGQHVLQEGEQSSWQVTCRICVPALAFTNQSVKKVHHRVYHQTMCTIGAPEPGHTIKVYREDDHFFCPKCRDFCNRDPVSLQTHAKNCKAVYTGPSDPPAPPASRGSAKPKSRRPKASTRVPAADQMTFDADGKPIAPVEGEGVNATIAGRSQTTEDSSAGKVWMCTRCDPPIQLKSESDRAMHYRKTHQMETSITDPAGQVHLIRRSEDGFFRCLRCPGYTSRDSVLARTHIIKSCRFPWPVTPGQVDPNTVEVPAQTSSPRETKRRRKDPRGPSALGASGNGANSAAASGSKPASTSPVAPLSYAAGPSSSLYSQPQASYGQQYGYAPSATSHDSYTGQTAYASSSYALPPPPSHESHQAADAYGAALTLCAGLPGQGHYSDAGSTYLAYAAAVGGDPIAQAIGAASYNIPPADVPQQNYAVAEHPAQRSFPAISSARAQPLAPMATPEVLQALPSVERVAFVRLLEENELARQKELSP